MMSRTSIDFETLCALNVQRNLNSSLQYYKVGK